MQNRQEIIVLSRSKMWRSTIEHMFRSPGNGHRQNDLFAAESAAPPVKIDWALEIGDCLDELAKSPSIAAIIELTSPTLPTDCEHVRLMSRLGGLSGLFAVATFAEKKWLPLIRVSGFVDCCFSTTQSRILSNRVRRYLSATPTVNESIESTVHRQLPWRPKHEP